MPEQSHKIVWIPIDRETPGAEPVLASTKNGTVQILRLHQQKDDAHWRDESGTTQGDIAFEDVSAWAHLPASYDPNGDFLLEGHEICEEIGVTLMMVQIAEDRINKALLLVSAEEGVTMEELDKMDRAYCIVDKSTRTTRQTRHVSARTSDFP